MKCLFFKLESGQLVNLDKLQLIEKHSIYFEGDDKDSEGLPISPADYERIQKILNPDWIDIEAAMDWASKEIERKLKD
jgi:hypothetical protein